MVFLSCYSRTKLYSSLSLEHLCKHIPCACSVHLPHLDAFVSWRQCILECMTSRRSILHAMQRCTMCLFFKLSVKCKTFYPIAFLVHKALLDAWSSQLLCCSALSVSAVTEQPPGQKGAAAAPVPASTATAWLHRLCPAAQPSTADTHC